MSIYIESERKNNGRKKTFYIGDYSLEHKSRPILNLSLSDYTEAWQIQDIAKDVKVVISETRSTLV